MSRSSTPSKILYPAGAAPFTQAAFDKYLSDNDGCLPPGALYQILDGPNAGIWVAPTIEGADPVCLASKDQVAALSDALDGLVIPTADGETIEAAADGTWSVPALTGGGEGQYLTVDANGDLVWSDLPASGGGGAVETDATLTGDGSVADPLGLPLLSDLGAAPTVLGPPVWIDDSATPNCLMFWDCNANGGAGAYVTFTQEGAGSGGGGTPAAWDEGTATLDLNGLSDGEVVKIAAGRNTNASALGAAVVGVGSPNGSGSPGTVDFACIYAWRAGTQVHVRTERTGTTGDNIVEIYQDTPAATATITISNHSWVTAQSNLVPVGGSSGGGLAPLPASVAAAWNASTNTLDASAITGAAGGFMLRGAIGGVTFPSIQQFTDADVSMNLGFPFTAMYTQNTAAPTGQWYFGATTPDDDADNDASTHGAKSVAGGATTQSIGHPGGTGFFKVTPPPSLVFNPITAPLYAGQNALHISLDNGVTWSALI